MTPSFANSDACKPNKPRSIQRREPFTTFPIPGMSTRTNNTKTTNKQIQRIRCQKLVGME